MRAAVSCLLCFPRLRASAVTLALAFIRVHSRPTCFFSILTPALPSSYMLSPYMAQSLLLFHRELKKGSAELLILSLLEARPRHGYEISQLIEEQSHGALTFNIASFYPLLYRLEKRGWILGRWVEKTGQRRRRYYKLTPAGRLMLQQQRDTWLEFVAAMQRITGLKHA